MMGLIRILLLLLLTACITTKEKNRQTVNQLQLQEEMQRLYTRFSARISEAYKTNEDIVQEHGMVLLNQFILYDSEALKIATGPFPVINYLDMMVFFKINEMTVKDYWIPQVYGNRGYVLLKAFQDSEKDIESIAHKFVKNPDFHLVDKMVREWRKENPQNIRVEKIRFSDFAEFAKKEDMKSGFSFSIVDMEKAQKAVDEVALVANRSLFLAQHIPLTLRLQMRLGTQEMISDTINHLQSSHLNREVEKVRPMLGELTDLAVASGQMIKDLRGMLTEMRNNPKKANIDKRLGRIDAIIVDASKFLRDFEAQKGEPGKIAKTVKQELSGLLYLIFFLFVSAGIVISASWWGFRYWYTKKTTSV